MGVRMTADAVGSRIHLLDVGEKQYGDAIFCQLGDRQILIDGGHKGDDVGDGDHDSIPDQLRALTGTAAGPVVVDLLVVTHLHDDHIGCLPEMVDNRAVVARNALVLDPSWRWDGAPDATPTDAVAVGARQVALALAEEPRSPALSDAQLLEFLADAASLKDRYVGMLTELDRQGNLVRYGVDDHGALERAFASVGLRILGPSAAQLRLTQRRVLGDVASALRSSSDALRTDSTTSTADLYRQILRAQLGGEDATDGRGGPGSSLNLQSLITLFRFDRRKALLTGDMQLADPESSDPALQAELAELNARIAAEAQDAPYDFVKLAHHGSWNGFDQEISDALGDTRNFGICAGATSTAHPDASVLDLLADLRPAVKWARTDRNRQSTFSFGKRIDLKVARGRKSDHRPNKTDAPEPVVATSPIIQPALVHTASSAAGVVEIITRLHAPARVRLAIEVDALGRAEVSADPVRVPAEGRTRADLNVAGGRKLSPDLLVVTSAAGLARNISAGETTRVLTALREAGVAVFDAIPIGLTDAAPAIALVNAEVRRRPNLEGVLILGGYDVVPAQRQDCLTPQLRRAVEQAIAAGADRDLDDHIVWSDDVYAGADPNDPLPRVPISRIPDAGSAEFVIHALSATKTVVPARSGIRNVNRKFADDVFAKLPGDAPLGVSLPVTNRVQPPFSFSPWAYFMLHGSNRDATRFWGEDAGRKFVLAFDINLVKSPAPEVAFAGCCWGALPVQEKASELPRGRVPTSRGPRDAICLAYLDHGALGFVGCTGSHYSPGPPYDYAGAPMHYAFWQARQLGHGPARALFEAKRQYRQGIPHGVTWTMDRAVEYKTFYQFTCLGLGW